MGLVNTDHKENIYWINTMKGILIILMVLSHTHIMAREYIFLFHMPVFFMISGYCWNNNHSTNEKNLLIYVKKKTIRLYVPFVLLNVLYILLFNAMLRVGFFTSDPSFLELVINPAEKQHVYLPMSLQQMVRAIGRAFIFAGGANELCNPTWFLASLWLASIFHAALENLLFRSSWLQKRRNGILCVCFIIVLFAAWFFETHSISLPGVIRRAPCTYSCYLGGVVLRIVINKPSVNKIMSSNVTLTTIIMRVLIAALGLLVLFLAGIRIRLSSYVMENPLILIIVMLLGWYLIMDISLLIGNNTILNYIGNNTMPILLFHLTAFKIVSFVYLKLQGENPILLASFPVVYSTTEWIRFIYGIIGVTVPLIIYYPYKRIKLRIKNKLV